MDGPPHIVIFHLLVMMMMLFPPTEHLISRPTLQTHALNTSLTLNRYALFFSIKISFSGR